MKKIITICMLVSSIFGNEFILNSQKQNNLKVEEKRLNSTYDFNNNLWIEPLTIKGSWNNDQIENDKFDKHDISIKFSQTVYDFGGIGFYMDLAEDYLARDKFLNEKTKLDYYKAISSLRLNHSRLEFLLKQSKLRNKNNLISYDIRKEKYELGKSDISDLNLLLIEIEKYREQIVDLEFEQEIIDLNIKEYTDKRIEDIKLPILNIPKKEDYIKKNIDFMTIKNESNVQKTLLNITKSSYLPAIKLDASYGNRKETIFIQDTEYYSYGISFSMPLSYNTFKDIEVSRINLLKNDIKLTDLENILKINYEKSLILIRKYEAKKDISRKNISSYLDLLKYTEEEYAAGYKTKLDVDTFKNLLEINRVDIKIQDILIQKEIYKLYYEMLK